MIKKNFFSADLEHLRAVKTEKHHQFAKDRDLLSYFVSAKTGESVEILFRQVTARLMHIVLPKNDSEATRVIKASIIRQESANATPISSTTTQSNQTRTSICTLQ
jgi:Ras-related protein Rab-28